MITRRDCLRALMLSAVAVGANAVELPAGHPKMKEAMHYDKLSDGMVGCRLCPRRCTIADGNTGFCRARKNMGGTLYSLGYASPCAVHIDPIEKKPLFNVLPGTYAFSIASAGCNLRCKFCQNWQISQISPLEAHNYYAPPAKIAEMAREQRCQTVAYTYSEPTSYYEYMLDTAREVHKAGLLNVYHSNGFINQGPLKELCKHLYAANVDLKGFSEDYYRNMSEAWLSPVLETLKTLKRSGVWLEITNLHIPGYNDDAKMVKSMCEWIADELGADTPLHFSRFFPLYKLTAVPPTPVETLERARDIAIKAGLDFVYIGNVPGHPGEHTYCPKCKKILVKRAGFTILENNLSGGRCKYCGKKIKGRWDKA